MSGVTGVRGPQGVGGAAGSAGSQGLTGPRGPFGYPGVNGLMGPTGISGGTGTQLYGHGSVTQSAISGSELTSDIGAIPFEGAKNPPLSSEQSTTINGQYDTTGLNFYGSPMTLDSATNTFITLPVGKYYITAIAPIYTASATAKNVHLLLSTYDGASYTDIAYSTPAFTKQVCHLQTIYTPAVDTILSIRLSSLPVSASLSPGNTVSLSIVKFW